VEIELPFDFLVEGTPVSPQESRSIEEWKARIVRASRAGLSDEHLATGATLEFLILYFPVDRIEGDRDMAGPIVAALEKHIYRDKSQVYSILEQQIVGAHEFYSPSSVLLDALNKPRPFVYVRLSEPDENFGLWGAGDVDADLSAFGGAHEAVKDARTSILEGLRRHLALQDCQCDVFLDPSPAMLPPFMEGLRPDAIAVSPEEKILFEFVRPPADLEKTKRLQYLTARHSDWELRVIFIPPGRSPAPVDVNWRAEIVPSRAAIDQAIAAVHDQRKRGHAAAALLGALSVIEAIGRALHPYRVRGAPAPAVVGFLADAGYLDPDESDFVRSLIPLQNTAVQGALDAAVNEQALDQFIAILERLATHIR
jgi:hypothetical protein